ncbi:MAG: hypothetical protein KGY50_04380 [Candidatus Thermoplasmatota archaeon]|nr:hypothetical protein [Candidatus Thermoplasmatota archaeon]
MDLKWKIGFAITAIASILLVLVSLYDILYLQRRFFYWFVASIALVIWSVFLFFYMYQSSGNQMDTIVSFEKTLHGRLYHFKCSQCGGIFALKESRKNDIRNLKLTCPDCGSVGRISSHPPQITDCIPSEKSPRVSFICTKCGERLNVWAEGKTLSDHISIFSCPYCGSKKPLKPQ